MMETATILHAAENLLIAQFGCPMRLEPLEIRRGIGSLVIRCKLKDLPANVPSTLLVKHTFPRPEYPLYDVYALLNDWAACQLLNHIEADPLLAPYFYGGDTNTNTIVLEDLGDGSGPNTIDLLNGDNSDLAEAGLVEHVTLLARLHGMTLGKAEQYQRLRDRLGPKEPNKPLYTDPWSNARRRHSEDTEVHEAIRRYRAVFEQVGVSPEPGVEEEITHITHTVEDEPEPFLALCKGDQNLGGDYIRCGDKLRLFDFGASGFRHALIEGMPGRMTWGCYGRIPSSVVAEMEAAYQLEFAHFCPTAGEEAHFQRALIEAGARWNILHVIHRIPHALERDGSAGPTTLRWLRVNGIEAFADLSEQLDRMPALGRSARNLADRLRRLWSLEGAHKLYPAFNSLITSKPCSN